MAKKSEQQSLIPEQRIEVGYQLIKIDELPKTINGPEPDAAMVRSVRSLGILQPLLLADRGKGFEVLDGRRRLLAAREAELPKVPCIVALNAQGVPIKRVLTIVANRRRSMNWQSEFAAVEELLGKGYSEQQLVEATGIGKNELRRLLRLRQLVNSLRLAFVDGELNASVAEAAAKLPAAAQHRLSKKLGDGRITLKDVREAHQVETVKAAKELPADLFGAVERADWRAGVLDKLDELAAIVPDDDISGQEILGIVSHMQSLLIPMAEGGEENAASNPDLAVAGAGKPVADDSTASISKRRSRQ
jgi:ParB/RepB/Spo0J family partition protein